MEHRLPNWRRTFAAPLLLTAVAAVGLTAQEQPASGSKFKVLVLPLQRTAAARGDFGEDVANEVRKLIETMQRHEPIEKKEISDALRKYQLKQDDMDCIKNMQLATQISAELAMCGRFAGTKGSFTVDSVKFISTKSQEAFEVPAITAPDAKAAAQQIFAAFQRAVSQIEVLAFCYQYLESQQWQDAIKNCDEALKINPQSIRANTGKAFAIYHMAGTGDQTDQAKLQEALAIYRRVLEIEPLEQEALRTAGIIAARVGQQDESRKYFKSYLELNPGDASVRIAIASEQATAGDPEGALRVVEEGLKADSVNVDLLTYAAVYAAQAAYKAQEKGRDNQASTELVPEAKTLFETAATYYKRLFDFKNADVEPTVAQQYIQTLLLLERFPDAVDVGRRAAEKPNVNTAVLGSYAAALANVGQTAEAIRIFDMGIAKNDSLSKTLHARKADVLIRGGDLARAKEAYRAAIAAGDVTGDKVSDLVWRIGMNEKYTKKDWDGFAQYLSVAQEFAEGSLERSKISFWRGMMYSAQAAAFGQPQKASEARAALQVYQRALNALEEGAEFGRSDPRYNYAQTVKHIRDYIDYLQKVIKAG